MKLRYCYIFLLTIVWISGCRSASEKHNNIFYWNIAVGITSLDPAFARIQPNIWVTHQLFNGLVEMDDSLQVIPGLAKNWEISANGKTYTFYLRQNVLFHPSQAFKNPKERILTAHDVVYSFSRLVDGATASPGAWVFNDKIESAEKAFVAVNDTVFQLNLKQPFAPMLQLLTLKYCSVVPQEAVEFYGKDFRAHPVGTGPFMLKKYFEGEKLLIERNNEYFEKDENGNRLPYIEGAEITFIGSKQNEFFSFTKGDLSFMTGLDKSFKDNILTKGGSFKERYSSRYNVETIPYLNTEYLGFLVDEKLLGQNPLRQLKVRQAINYAIDRDKMMKHLRNNIGEPGIYGFVPPQLLRYNKKYYTYDPQKAVQLLREAGFGPGKPIKGIKLVTVEQYLDLAIYVQKQLETLGIIVEIDNVPTGTLSDWKAQSKTSFFRGSWIADYADAENYLSVFYSKNWAPDGPNYFHYKNEAFDKLYERALAAITETEKQELYTKMQDILMHDAPVVVLFYDEIVRLKQKNVSGLNANAINLVSLKRVRLN